MMSVWRGLQRHAVERQKGHAADDEGKRHQHDRVEEDLGDEAVKEDAEDRRGQEGDDNAEREALRPPVARQVGERAARAAPHRRQRRARIAPSWIKHLERRARRWSKPRSRPASRRCAVDETGMNSVTPSTTPSTIASMIAFRSMRFSGSRSARNARPNRLVPAGCGFYTRSRSPSRGRFGRHALSEHPAASQS